MKFKEIMLFCLATLLIVSLFIGVNGLYTVKPGVSALHLRFKKIVHCRTEGGLYFKVPFIDEIIDVPTYIQKTHIETTALSKDLQAIEIGITVNYRYLNEVELYKNTLGHAEDIIIIPFCHETIKAIVALYTAEELIHHRHKAKEGIHRDLTTKLKPHYIEFIEVNFSHADFSKEFILAVEGKQIALQESMRSKHVTEAIREKSNQQKIIADADAYSQNIKKASLTPELVQLKAIEKWNGILPTMMNGAVPFINVTK